ncbi:putative selenate reductase subunit YgfK [Candidatus Bipolaricaulota bacterium]
MSEQLRVLPFEVLLDWILKEYESHRSIFGIHEAVFYKPTADDPFSSTLFGDRLATPIGPAAGPHTQLTQNILSAWLTGGRFIELKTVQIMDELDIPRPCIDLADEGYNVEWSQELRLQESVLEYVKAWVLVRIFRRLLGFEEAGPFGTIFNMSIGYNLEGILSPPMQQFMSRLEDASEDLAAIRSILRTSYPQFADIEIPERIVNSVTLSTMHGCPPDEIERIASYLIEERGLHTTVKLNPTLLGKQDVLNTLHETLGFSEIAIPDSVFELDLAYDRALELIRSLQESAQANDVIFSVKLSNTLAMSNHRDVLAGEEMYMSGRALFPITVQLYKRLRSDIGPDLRVSYSAGADAVNLTDLLLAGALPITVASDLLKPGGYGRFAQYISGLRDAMATRGISSLGELSREPEIALERLVQDGLTSPRYKKAYHPFDLPKVESELDAFDCIEAPCMAQCAVCQNVPEYAHWIRTGDYERAVSAILRRNPLPASTGHVCTNLCQTSCTRNNYDESVAIRRLKRFAIENGSSSLHPAAPSGHRVAVIGSGPSGLAAAFYLALSGIQVAIFEAKERPGGMLAIAPQFRLPSEVVDSDIGRIQDLGVEIHCNHKVEETPEALLESGYSAVYVACGFADDAGPRIEGIETAGVMGALDFLNRVARGDLPELGDRVIVIGGGNTAMDAARTAQRLTGEPTTVAYRRTKAEMPAEEEEVHDLLIEGNRLEELSIPCRVFTADGRVTSLECLKAELGEPDADGRRRPVPIAGSEFTIPASTVILAIGQRSDTDFLAESKIVVRESDGGIDVQETGRTSLERVYAGGDIARGPAIIIAACADGRTAAESICQQLDVKFKAPALPALQLDDVPRGELKATRVRQSSQLQPAFLDVADRGGFDLVEATFTKEGATTEAERCLQCQLLCDKCVEVCPNRANIGIRVKPFQRELPLYEFVDGQLQSTGSELIRISQSQQILHIDELCNECGNCTTFCVHQGRPYRDKPRLFLDRETFEAETENAYRIDPDGISSRAGGATSRLSEAPDGQWIYETANARLALAPDFSVIDSQVEGSAVGTISLRPAVEMALLLRAIRSDGDYLPQSLAIEGRDV